MSELLPVPVPLPWWQVLLEVLSFALVWLTSGVVFRLSEASMQGKCFHCSSETLHPSPSQCRGVATGILMSCFCVLSCALVSWTSLIRFLSLQRPAIREWNRVALIMLALFAVGVCAVALGMDALNGRTPLFRCSHGTLAVALLLMGFLSITPSGIYLCLDIVRNCRSGRVKPDVGDSVRSTGSDVENPSVATESRRTSTDSIVLELA